MNETEKNRKVKEALEVLLPGAPEYYDYQKLVGDARREYVADAQAILNSNVFKNEMRFVISRMMEKCIMSGTELSHLENTRSAILALEDYKARLEEIQSWQTDEPAKNPHEPL